mmetsp:Transcript_14690/g.28967  ORF Transcript_14690/g.28967 Transcript_14690/m.28967 type:complete len:83 (+) Transcript_14690:1262-1510(+)
MYQSETNKNTITKNLTNHARHASSNTFAESSNTRNRREAAASAGVRSNATDIAAAIRDPEAKTVGSQSSVSRLLPLGSAMEL